MGSVLALPHSGVSGTISTLWGTDSLVGKRFFQNFYDRRAGNLADGWTTADLATAFQQAVVALAHDRTALPSDRSLEIDTAETALAKRRAFDVPNPPLY